MVISRILLIGLLIIGFWTSWGGAQESEVHLMAYLTSFDYDEELKKLGHVYNLYVDKNRKEVLVLDSFRSKITFYKLENLYPYLTLDFRSGINSPVGAVVDREGYIYVLQNLSEERSEILIFNRGCLKEGAIVSEKGHRIMSFAVNSKGEIYALLYKTFSGNGNGWHTKVFVYNRKGELLREVDFTNMGLKFSASLVKIDQKDNLYFIDTQAGRIYCFDSNLRFRFSFGEKGGVTGKLSQPKDIAIDEEKGLAYVVDYMRHVVNVYDLKQEGKYVYEFGGYGNVEGWFLFPSAVGVDDQGRVYVADTFNKRVQVLTPYSGLAKNLDKIKDIPPNRVVKLKDLETDSAYSTIKLSQRHLLNVAENLLF